MSDLTDEKFMISDFALLTDEECRQMDKWDVQTHTIWEWLAFTLEELGELSQAISDYVFRRVKTPDHIIREAVQTATLSLKIAVMAREQLPALRRPVERR